MIKPLNILVFIGAFICGLVITYHREPQAEINWWIPIMFISGLFLGHSSTIKNNK